MDNKYTLNLKDIKVETENPIAEINKPPKKIGKVKKFFSCLVLFLIVAGAFFAWQIKVSSQNSSGSWLSKLNIISTINNVVVGSDKKLKGEELDRINILLLGVGGKNHDGGTLTDTIMLVSLQPSTKKVAMVSIPRDLAVPIENMGWRKINSVNAFAEKENPGSGGLAISQTVSDIMDIPIDYYVRVDFQGFINIIDQLGGVEVNVENTLDDYSYPVLGNEDAYPYESRYEHLHVDTGLQKMDGSLALKFARSRHGIRGEGSDFARAKRQQKIIEAAKEKLLSMNVLFKPTMVGNIINELQEHISTNLKIWEIVKLWDYFKDTKSDNIINKVLDDSPNGLLASSISSEGAYILSPRSGDFNEVQYLVKNAFNDANTTNGTKKAKEEKSKLEIYNGTWINGLAGQFATDMEKEGFEILRYGNSSKKDFQKNVIYDLSFGAKPESLNILKTKTNANVSTELPQWLKDDLAKYESTTTKNITPDFVVILGHSADNTASGEENKNQ